MNKSALVYSLTFLGLTLIEVIWGLFHYTLAIPKNYTNIGVIILVVLQLQIGVKVLEALFYEDNNKRLEASALYYSDFENED